jgi:glutamine amidotransferase
LGNLLSITQACLHAGIEVHVTSDRESILSADAVILPGVGAFGDAMATLRRLDLVGVLKDVAASGKPFLGICLGIQLLMTESHEFGSHRGLGIVEGEVVPLEPGSQQGRPLKVPHVGWNALLPAGQGWKGSLLEGIRAGADMYFVHSYVVRPENTSLTVSTTRYGDELFCSSLSIGNIFACQYHPERSASMGLRIYANFRAAIDSTL